jgi:hypothetical protein
LREREDEFRQHNVRIFVVTFESEKRVNDYQRKEHVPYPVLRDPRREAYRRFGLERRAAHRVYRPATIRYYIKRFFQGRMPERVKADPYQLGGDVLLDADGSVLWMYRSSEPADRPSVDDILKEIAKKASESGV